jgi:hypothetical protein
MAGTVLCTEDCIECPIVKLQIKKKNLLEKSDRSIKYYNRGEISVTIGKRKGFSGLEVHTNAALKQSARRAAVSLCGTGSLFLSPRVRRLCISKKVTET